MPSIGGENRSVSPSVIEDTVTLEVADGGGEAWDGRAGGSAPHPETIARSAAGRTASQDRREATDDSSAQALGRRGFVRRRLVGDSNSPR